MTIEPVVVSDAEAILSIYSPYVLGSAVTFEYDVPGVDEFRERIKNISTKFPYVKAVDESSRILGYAYASTFKNRRAYDWCVETSIYVERGFRRAGLGAALYGELEKRLQKMGILNLNACITFPKGESDPHLSKDSVKFHEKMGFKMVGMFHDCGYKFDTWYNMVWMEKMIGEHRVPQPPVRFGLW